MTALIQSERIFHTTMKTATVSYSSEDLKVGDFSDIFWMNCPKVEVNLYWSGKSAEDARKFDVQMAWTENSLLIRFAGNQREPLNVNSSTDLSRKNRKLWERDVFEIFVAPDAENVRRYFEFEVAPTGEWLDLKMQISEAGERQPDFEYDSGMEVSARILENEVQAIMKIGWDAFGKKPALGDVWRGNLFRCIGSGETRGYLAWQPTETAEPDFHVPDKFGYFEFIK